MIANIALALSLIVALVFGVAQVRAVGRSPDEIDRRIGAGEEKIGEIPCARIGRTGIGEILPEQTGARRGDRWINHHARVGWVA